MDPGQIVGLRRAEHVDRFLLGNGNRKQFGGGLRGVLVPLADVAQRILVLAMRATDFGLVVETVRHGNVLVAGGTT
jgi:hypothetical protein